MYPLRLNVIIITRFNGVSILCHNQQTQNNKSDYNKGENSINDQTITHTNCNGVLYNINHNAPLRPHASIVKEGDHAVDELTVLITLCTVKIDSIKQERLSAKKNHCKLTMYLFLPRSQNRN